jgi:hypothetical protein
VFLGGTTISLWMTDPAARAPRVTYDVDVVAEIITLAGYEAFAEELNRMMQLPVFDYGAEGALAGPDARDRVAAVTIPRLDRLIG